MVNKLDFFHSMMELAIKKGNYLTVSAKHCEFCVRVKEEKVGYYDCEGMNFVYIPLEHEIEKVERYEAGGFYHRMVKLTDGTVLKVRE